VNLGQSPRKVIMGLVKHSYLNLNLIFAVMNGLKKNSFFMESSLDHIAVGGGGGNAIYLDEDFYNGRSSHCDTYNNDILASGDSFECVLFECWGFSKYVL